MSPRGPLIVRHSARPVSGLASLMPVTRIQARAQTRAARGASPPGRTAGTHKSRTVSSWQLARLGCSVAVRRRVSAALPARPASAAKTSRRGRRVEQHEWNRCTRTAPAAPSRADPRRSTDHGATRPPTLGHGAAFARTRGALAQDPATRVAGWLCGTRPPQPRRPPLRCCGCVGHPEWHSWAATTPGWHPDHRYSRASFGLSLVSTCADSSCTRTVL
jgi:hypothetical protein